MSLAGFKATNHPQQTAKRGAVDATDDRETDREFYALQDKRFGFNLDVAAAGHNRKCPDYLTIADDALQLSWKTLQGRPARVWCNPPYSDIRAWVQKASDEYASGNCDVIVMLLPANRTEQAWWQDLVEPTRDRPGSHLRVEFLRGRMRFHRPDWQPGPKGDRPPFGCCLLIWGLA